MRNCKKVGGKDKECDNQRVELAVALLERLSPRLTQRDEPLSYIQHFYTTTVGYTLHYYMYYSLPVSTLQATDIPRLHIRCRHLTTNLYIPNESNVFQRRLVNSYTSSTQSSVFTTKIGILTV